jgi:hypothetical protein
VNIDSKGVTGSVLEQTRDCARGLAEILRLLLRNAPSSRLSCCEAGRDTSSWCGPRRGLGAEALRDGFVRRVLEHPFAATDHDGHVAYAEPEWATTQGRA